MNASDILALENKLKQTDDTINENERGLSFNRGFFFYKDQSYLVYDCKMGSLIFIYAINIYCVYKLDPIASRRGTSFTIKNALFGAMQITKNATDNSKNNYKGYGICFDERSQFSHTITEDGRTHTTNGRNVLIFGVDMSFSAHATNRANHIYLMDDGLTQSINDTTLYVEKNYWRNFTDPGKKFIISLHYNGDESYFFVNGRRELKFKAKTHQLVKERLCIGNLSDQWTTSESEKTGLYGNIFDFVVDYEQIVGVKTIYNMHRYLMTKHNISP